MAVVAPQGCLDDEAWLGQLSAWVEDVSEFSGNPVAEIVVSREELAERRGDALWETIRREGVTVAAAPRQAAWTPAGGGGCSAVSRDQRRLGACLTMV